MRKFYMLSLLLLLSAGAIFAQFRQGSTAWVSANSVNLKSSTWFFAANRGVVNYGDQVTVLQVSGNWVEVRSSSNASLSGWISTGNLSSRRITAAGSGVTASEVALAGKGFNQEVENSYRTGGTLNYADVDRTETLTVSDEELHSFIVEGRLAAGENR